MKIDWSGPLTEPPSDFGAETDEGYQEYDWSRLSERLAASDGGLELGRIRPWAQCRPYDYEKDDPEDSP